MSVAEYESKFTELARYAPHMVDTVYKKVRKFEDGLNVEILDRINVLKVRKEKGRESSAERGKPGGRREKKKGGGGEEGSLVEYQDSSLKLWKIHLQVTRYCLPDCDLSDLLLQLSVIRRMTKLGGVCLESVLDSQPMCLPWRFRS
ncbi:uncharacterized protein LOC114320524 [Camellia sinensis]|uniref:uncharacterized protein LOC114320524 n=1 Tax=Camellia sinensis TaxID=4442 RepID=UPI0010360430|nr:uncharacterized protein LOC114320524 [Camellia sinensis]